MANGLDQYLTVAGTGITHDARGNLTADGTRTFTYDIENRLLTASGPTAVSLGYDPLGRLQTTTASGATTTYLYDGQNLVGEYNAAGTVLRRYVPGPGVDEPALWYEGAGTTGRRWPIADEAGSIIGYTGPTGGSAGTYGYGPFGEPDVWTGLRSRYTGQIMIPEAQLYYYKARVYDPGLGRFLQTDPVGQAGGVNIYAYVGNDPLNFTDSSGLTKPDNGPIKLVNPGVPDPAPEELVVTAPKRKLPENSDIQPIQDLNAPREEWLKIASNEESASGTGQPAPHESKRSVSEPNPKPKKTVLCNLGDVAQGGATSLGRAAGALSVAGVIPNPLSPELLAAGTFFGIEAFAIDMIGVVLSTTNCAKD